MNKRSATIIAATLVGVLAIGGTAFSLGLTGPSASNATDGPTTAGPNPTVNTQSRTVIVHRQASSTPVAVVQDASSNSGPSASSGPGNEESGDDHGDDHEGENEGENDHGDHGGEDHDGGDDHEGEDEHGGDDD